MKKNPLTQERVFLSLATTYFPAEEIPSSIIGPRGLTTVVGMGTGVSPWVSGHQASVFIGKPFRPVKDFAIVPTRSER